MYGNFQQLREGWTKNLALLFPNPTWLATQISLWWIFSWTMFAIGTAGLLLGYWRTSYFLLMVVFLYRRIARANFRVSATLMSTIFGMPMFAYLLLRSKHLHGKGSVSWKGRTYSNSDDSKAKSASNPTNPALMKTTIILFLAIAFALVVPSTHAQITEEPHFSNVLIDPGHSLGPLKLNDPADHAQELFPKKDIDQEWDDPCGTTYEWTDSNNPNGHGHVLIRSKKDKIFQIESSSSRFNTPEGIATFDSPQKVADAYKELRAWALLTRPAPALGSRPLVFWIDKKKGIAFELAYDAQQHKRYVYKIIVFIPNKTFCPEQETIDSLKWQSIDPYALEPPKELSPERITPERN